MGQVLVNVLVGGSLVATVGLGFSLIYRTERFFHLAHGAVFTAGGYIVYSLSAHHGLSMVVAVLAAIALSGILGLAIRRLVYRPLQARRATSSMLLVASLAAFIAVQNILGFLGGYGPRALPPGSLGAAIRIEPLNANITLLQVVLVGATATAYLAAGAALAWTSWGRALRAVADDRELAVVQGVAVERVLELAHLGGSMVAGAGAAYAALELGVWPRIGLDLLLPAVVAVIVGGLGSVAGAYIGAFLLSALRELTAWYWSATWSDLLVFTCLLVILLLRPEGLLGGRWVKPGGAE